ncbi:MAG: HAD family hydrolase [bacterium]
MKAVFLDRDGVINVKPPDGKYVTSWLEFKFIRNAARAIKLLNKAEYAVIIVTNQRGVALQHLTEGQLKTIHKRMVRKLKDYNAHIDGIYYCPHDKDSCDCRKPSSGLFSLAKNDFPAIDFSKSWVIGDSLSDVEAGRNLGCKTILITKKSKIDNDKQSLSPHFIAPSLWQAVNKYLVEN